MKPNFLKFAVVCAMAAGFWVVSSGCQREHAPTTEPTTTATVTNAIGSSSGAVRAEFQKLTGKWLRPDGGYVLEVKNVAADGSMEAGYFNPGTIRVSKALALQEGTTTKVFVELRDVNYPGCTYSLTYDPKTDQLYGLYFQAAIQQTFDVTFGRLKE